MRKKQKGFTMMELIIVILLTAIVGSIVASRFSRSSVFSQRTVFDQTQYLLKLGQKTAIAQRRTVYVSAGVQELRLCYTNTSPCPDSQSVSAQNVPIAAKTQNIIVNIPAGLNFNSQGIASNNLITIAVGTKNILIEGTTGYVHD